MTIFRRDEYNCRYRDGGFYSITFRLARWDRVRGRYLELFLLGKHIL